MGLLRFNSVSGLLLGRQLGTKVADFGFKIGDARIVNPEMTFISADQAAGAGGRRLLGVFMLGVSHRLRSNRSHGDNSAHDSGKTQQLAWVIHVGSPSCNQEYYTL